MDEQSAFDTTLATVVIGASSGRANFATLSAAPIKVGAAVSRKSRKPRKLFGSEYHRLIELGPIGSRSLCPEIDHQSLPVVKKSVW